MAVLYGAIDWLRRPGDDQEIHDGCLAPMAARARHDLRIAQRMADTAGGGGVNRLNPVWRVRYV
ncbi:MAG: hypothetical protein R3E65_10225 [Steroidobacteraceae bacterium]